jgi:hypothetical protein
MARAGQGDGDERRATSDAAREIEKQKLAERMRQSADALRQGKGRDGQQQEIARALDDIADRLTAASGAQNADARRASEQLGRAQTLRDRLNEIGRNVEQLQREAQQAQNQQNQLGASPNGQSAGQQQAAPQTPQRAEGGQGSGQQSAQGREGSQGQSGGGSGGNGGRLEQLQREVNEQMREAERLAQSIERENPGMPGGNSDEGWWRSFSAPGTEAFKQDFSRWESLKKNLLVALEDVETKLSGEIRELENKQRLNAGGHSAVSEPYRALVEKYYRSLAAPRR